MSTKKLTTPRSLIWAIIIIFILVGSTYLLNAIRTSLIESIAKPTLSAPIRYEPVSLPQEFEQMWTKTPIFTPFNQYYGSLLLSLNEEVAFLLGDPESSGEPYSLMSINLINGEVRKVVTFHDSRPTTLGLNSKFVYVGIDGTQKISGDTRWGASKIEAYNIDSGALRWSRIVDGARSVETMLVTENVVSVRGSTSTHSFLLDASTGDVLDKRRISGIDGENDIWFTEGNISYEESDTASFLAVDRQTSSTIWQSQKRYIIYQPPILDSNIIVARLGEANIPSAVIALDSNSGEMKWSYNNTLGNVTVGNSVVFFLTHDMEVKAVDIKTGQLLATIAFFPNAIQRSVHNKFYLGANDKNVLLVYFGGSQEIFAFRFIRD